MKAKPRHRRIGNVPSTSPIHSVCGREEPEAALQAELVFLAVFFVEFSPIAVHMPFTKFERGLSSLTIQEPRL